MTHNLSTLIHTDGDLKNNAGWTCKLKKKGRLGSPVVETTPFIFNNKFYLLENWQKYWDFFATQMGQHYLNDEVRIKDAETNEIISVPLTGYTFGIAFVWESKVYVFAGNHHSATDWRKVTELCMTCSHDLINWSKPQTVLKALDGEFFFNFAICRGKDSFVLLYETDDPQWKKFTFRYCLSDDLTNWTLLDNALYGKDKYVGGPALYYEGDYYYTLYLEDLGTSWETRITRSQDLIHWEDAPVDRPFLAYDSSIKNLPFHAEDVCECNASDAELCYWNDKTIVYFTGGIQHLAGDLQTAEFLGTPRELFEHYFEPSEAASNSKN